MILWAAVVFIAVAVIAAGCCLWIFARRRPVNDLALGSTLLTGLVLIVQIVIAAIAPAVGNPAAGDPLEFWMYLIVAAVLPFGAAFWALIDRSRSANLVLTVVNLAVAIMLYRMLVIWGG